MTSNQEQRIIDLQAALRPIAGKLARDYDIDFDDLLSEMNMAIIDRAERDPDFLDQEDNYIARWGGWRARDWGRRECYQRKFFQVPTTAEIEQIRPDSGDDPADLIEQADRIDTLGELIANLGEQTRRVLQLWAGGYKVKEIASELAITAPSVCYHKNQIRQGLRSASRSQKAAALVAA